MKYEWISLKLVLVCSFVFIIQYYVPSVTDQFALDSSNILAAPWTIVTYIFLHASFEHLFYNMFALFFFGSILEKIIGGRNFLVVFFMSGVFAGIGSMIFYSSSIGASGAVYGIIGALAVLRPRMFVISFGVPLPMVLTALIWVAGDIIGVFFPTENTAYMAHIFGIAFGAACGFYLRKKYSEEMSKRNQSFVTEREFRRWEDRWL